MSRRAPLRGVTPPSAPPRAPRVARSHARILDIVRRIPRGRVATYGQIAALAGMPRHARLVGYALHALPDDVLVPWHRVLGAGGRLSLLRAGRASGLTQQMRLEREGVRFDARGRADLKRSAWRPLRRAVVAPRRTGSARAAREKMRN